MAHAMMESEKLPRMITIRMEWELEMMVLEMKALAMMVLGDDGVRDHAADDNNHYGMGDDVDNVGVTIGMDCEEDGMDLEEVKTDSVEEGAAGGEHVMAADVMDSHKKDESAKELCAYDDDELNRGFKDAWFCTHEGSLAQVIGAQELHR